MNCPNCGAIIKTSDKYCEYCGTQNSFSIEDVMKTRIFCDGYVAEQQTVYEDIYVYRDADGRLHKSVEKHKDDKAALKEIDVVFDKPLAEVNG